jgi:hypothetical protein
MYHGDAAVEDSWLGIGNGSKCRLLTANLQLKLTGRKASGEVPCLYWQAHAKGLCYVLCAMCYIKALRREMSEN